MTTKKTQECLARMLEIRAEVVSVEMTEVPLVPVPAETAQAILNAINTLEGLRILMSIFTEERA